MRTDFPLNKKYGKYLILFGIIFLTLFWQFPINKSLPGNCDSLLAIALSNLYWEKIVLLFKGKSLATALFPALNVHAYGDYCTGLAAIFLFFKFLTQNDIWAYYFFITTIFTLNAFALFRFSLFFVTKPIFAVISALIFTLSNFSLTNIDDPNIIFFFFPLMGLFYFYKGIESGENKNFYRAFFLWGAQIYFGFYVFLLQFILVPILIIPKIKEKKSPLVLKSF